MTHPIIPSSELVEQWVDGYIKTKRDCTAPEFLEAARVYIAARAAQWGADQELEACCAFAENKWGLVNGLYVADAIRTARRPKPPSLKEQALDQLAFMEDRYEGLNTDYIRRALEQLDD